MVSASRLVWDGEGVDSVVSSLFSITDKYEREDGTLEYLIEDGDVKHKFEQLIQTLKGRGYMATLRKRDGELVLYVFRAPEAKKTSNFKPLVLLIATVIVVALDGYIRFRGLPKITLFDSVFLYTVSMMGIIGIHELGHKVASWYHRMRASLPYFIPGIPSFWPTLGAIITSLEPPVNRDSLFDLGISGPLAGLVTTFVVSVEAALASPVLTHAELSYYTSKGLLVTVNRLDVYTGWLINYFHPNQNVILSPLFFASSIGFLVTFLNLFPAWQLDGGHVINSALGPEKHKVATFVSAMVMMLMGFVLMGLLVLILSGYSSGMRPLDEVSPLSKGRKLAFIASLALLVWLYFFTIKGNMLFAYF